MDSPLHIQVCAVAIFGKVIEKLCNFVEVPLPFLRISAANVGPNLFHHNHTVSCQMSTPRSASRSSTLCSESG